MLLSLAALAVPGAASAQGPSLDGVKELEHALGMVLAILDVGTGSDDARADGVATCPRRAISATSSGGVMEHTIRSGYWGDHLIGARRLLAEPTSQ